MAVPPARPAPGPWAPVERRAYDVRRLAELSPLVADVAAGGAGSARATARLREAGELGVAALIEGLAAERAKAGPDEGRIARLVAGAERVAMQRHADRSGLFWHTDLETALFEAKRLRRPVLSLRLLGGLDEELSCANSRFFRVALYANERLSHYRSNHYVLHWSTERPAPRVTIDFGDGRTVVRTVTGNSVHYVLDATGRPVDALPGLYGPWAFQRRLMEAEGVAFTSASQPDADARTTIAAFHQRRLDQLEAAWASELAFAGGSPVLRPVGWSPGAGTPNALQAAPIAAAKVAVEMPMVRALLPVDAAHPVAIDTLPWEAIGSLHRDEARLDAASRALMREKSPFDWSVAGAPRPLSDAAFEKLVERFEKTLAIESARNELTLHATLDAGWATGRELPTFEALNRKVYAELFLTPRSDPWLGLLPDDVFSAIDDNGIRR